jgi:hypothetical protein
MESISFCFTVKISKQYSQILPHDVITILCLSRENQLSVFIKHLACNAAHCLASCYKYGIGTCDGPCETGYGLNLQHTCTGKTKLLVSDLY